jgi:hypothetical protein
MHDEVVSAGGSDLVFVSPRPSPPQRPDNSQTAKDPDAFINLAKRLVVENYNKHRDAERSSELPYDGVYIVWFAKMLWNWKAIVASPIVRGLIWEVTSNGYKHEVYIDVYKKLNNVKINLPENS